jgi:hypothetical protein
LRRGEGMKEGRGGGGDEDDEVIRSWKGKEEGRGI